jgi:transposase InsO family protein
VKYEFIANHEKEHSVKRMCESLGISRSGYYAWCKRGPSQREEANQALLAQIKQIFQESRQTYGSPRVHAVLQRQEIDGGRHRVARLMRKQGIVARKPKKRYPVTTQRQPGSLAAPNLLNQDFSATQPNQKWVGDITYIDTAEGWLYLAAILDLFARPVVGWAMADHMESSLVENAFKMALMRRSISLELIHHSDQGGQYTSYDYQNLLATAGCQVSMSRVGNCYDNATMESFFGTLKTECANQQFSTHAIAHLEIFEFIEVWYNRQRLHSSLGYLTPLEFEQDFFHLLKVST